MSSALNQCVQKNYMQRLKAEKELEIYKMKYEVLQEKVKVYISKCIYFIIIINTQLFNYISK